MFISYSEILESERLGGATTRGDQISKKVCGITSYVQMIYQAQMMTIISVYHFLGLSWLWNSLDSGRQVRKRRSSTCPWPHPVLTKVCFLKGCFDTVRLFHRLRHFQSISIFSLFSFRFSTNARIDQMIYLVLRIDFAGLLSSWL